jgi:hypothetical protein
MPKSVNGADSLSDMWWTNTAKLVFVGAHRPGCWRSTKVAVSGVGFLLVFDVSWVSFLWWRW